MKKIHKPRLRTLDLHNVKHEDAGSMVEVFLATEEAPLQVITGNSETMKRIVYDIADSYGLYYYCKDWYNLGSLIIMEKKINV